MKVVSKLHLKSNLIVYQCSKFQYIYKWLVKFQQTCGIVLYQTKKLNMEYAFKTYDYDQS